VPESQDAREIERRKHLVVVRVALRPSIGIGMRRPAVG
jgi:hypothetical protein